MSPVETAPVEAITAAVAQIAPVIQVSEPAVVVATAVAAPQVAQVQSIAPAAAAAPAAAPIGMPKLQAFELPMAELAQVAQNSGLNWVNSDAAKIAAVQASIAAEPKLVRVPRERPTATKVDSSPLVMVETKRDLRDMTLPFEEKASQ
jgi:ribonuclease E